MDFPRWKCSTAICRTIAHPLAFRQALDTMRECKWRILTIRPYS